MSGDKRGVGVRETLDQIGRRADTDKSSKIHDYLNFYESFLHPLRDEPATVLEVGVFKGSSIRMWAEYFTRATIIGADINLKRHTLGDHLADRIKLVRVDQGSAADLTGLGKAYGPFDVIIDDGSHRWDHQILTVQTLLPFVKGGGFFIMEDLHTSRPEDEAKYQGTSQRNTVDYLMALTRDVCLSASPGVMNGEQDPFLRSFMKELEFLVWRRSTLLMKRIKR
ncbi:class I SAM-dependent methyltransferase [Muricoccus radiodurans]|uniref:class I SAM-dependent methyltransferase n=1 Tax=Muricoccus radiodurans TaxID=2231721 RepID=UPI003CF4E329